MDSESGPLADEIAVYAPRLAQHLDHYSPFALSFAIPCDTPGLRFIRSNTVYALSFIRLQFEYGRDYHFVRQQALNRLKDVQLPPNVQDPADEDAYHVTLMIQKTYDLHTGKEVKGSG